MLYTAHLNAERNMGAACPYKAQRVHVHIWREVPNGLCFLLKAEWG